MDLIHLNLCVGLVIQDVPYVAVHWFQNVLNVLMVTTSTGQLVRNVQKDVLLASDL